MILQEIPDGLLIFRQTDHALLSGAFADAWGSETVPAPPRRESSIVAAARHDDGWADWELMPRTDGNGRPVDFIGIPVPEHVALYRHGIDLVQMEDPFAGAVASLHGERLYTRPFVPGLDPRIEHLRDEWLAIAQEYVDGERARQKRLLNGSGEAEAEEAWRLLQVWDRLSLFVCMQRLGSGADQTLPMISGPDGDIAITVRTPESDALTLDPYPFSASPGRFEIEAFVLAARTWPSAEDFRHDLRVAPRRIVAFECHPR